MFLGFELADLVHVPFGWLLDILYRFTTSYGWALILFSILVKLILMPTSIKSKRSMMKMSRLTPKIQYIQKKYENDQQKQTQAMQELYKQEGVSMGGGCLWSLLPLLILIPLYTVIREPITYILHQSEEVTSALMNAVATHTDALAGIEESNYYRQLIAAANLDKVPANVIAAIPGITNAERVSQGLNFEFLGFINLATQPRWDFWKSDFWHLAVIGAAMLPILSAGVQLLSMIISQKINNSLVTNEKGVQDKEAAKNSQSAQTGKVMLYMMPIMSLLIGYGMPAALSLYWLIQGVVGTIIDNLLTISLRKEYDTEDALRLQKAMEEELAELEKERIRAERRAANPDGITENTSKKKLQQKQKAEQDAAKAAARKEYNARKGIIEEEDEGPAPMSGIAERPYCKGRNYDPNRYASDITEE